MPSKRSKPQEFAIIAQRFSSATFEEIDIIRWFNALRISRAVRRQTGEAPADARYQVATDALRWFTRRFRANAPPAYCHLSRECVFTSLRVPAALYASARSIAERDDVKLARVIETGLHKMDTLGFDVTRVESAMGTAPLAPTAKSDTRAIGRTNDCVLYGGQARYTVRADDDELAALAMRLPASTSSDYGTPFYDIFKRYDNDFYKIDPLLFSPAEVWLTSATSGKTFHAGHVNPDVLRASLFES